MQKVAIQVVKEIKVDGRTNNTGRPVNVNSARQKRIIKQTMNELDMDYVMNGGWFKLTENCHGAYAFVKSEKKGTTEGHIATMYGGHECNINKIGRTKMSGYTFVMNKRVTVEFDVRKIIRVER